MKLLINVPEPTAAKVREFQRELNLQLQMDAPRRKPANYKHAKRYLTKNCAEYLLKHSTNLYPGDRNDGSSQ